MRKSNKKNIFVLQWIAIVSEKDITFASELKKLKYEKIADKFIIYHFSFII